MNSIDLLLLNPILSQEGDEQEGTGVAVIEKTKATRPPKYKVLIHNDDYTTMEFVIYILQKIFGKHYEEAKAIMMAVHEKGQGVCGVYTHEIAETKVQKVLTEAKNSGHPLRCTMERE